MSASFPSSVKSFTTKVDGAGNTIFAAHINDLQDEVVAVETALLSGLGSPIRVPSGSVATVALGVGDSDVGLYSSGTNALDVATNGVKALGIDATQFIDSPTQPRCQATNSAAQSIPDTTDTAVTFDTETYDVGSMHDTSSNTSRFTVPTGGDGLYLISATLTFAAGNALKRGMMWFRKNGATRITTYSGGPLVAGGFMGITQTTVVVLAAADYVEVMAWQESGGALNIGSAAATVANHFNIVKLW